MHSHLDGIPPDNVNIPVRDVFWSARTTRFQVSTVPDDGIPGPAMRSGEGVTTLCTSAGKPTVAQPASLPTSLAATSGDLHLVATPTSLIAYQAR